jgi:hypothetical protein
MEMNFKYTLVALFLMLSLSICSIGVSATPTSIIKIWENDHVLIADFGKLAGNITNNYYNTYQNVTQNITYNITNNITTFTGGSSINISTTSCSAGNHVSAINNASGVVTCSADTGSVEVEPMFNGNYTLFNPFYNMTTPAVTWVIAQNYSYPQWANILNKPLVINGTNGANGYNGTNGTNGVNGLNGTNGIDGTNGTNAYNITYNLTEYVNTTYNITNNYTVSNATIDERIGFNPFGYLTIWVPNTTAQMFTACNNNTFVKFSNTNSSNLTNYVPCNGIFGNASNLCTITSSGSYNATISSYISNNLTNSTTYSWCGGIFGNASNLCTMTYTNPFNSTISSYISLNRSGIAGSVACQDITGNATNLCTVTAGGYNASISAYMSNNVSSNAEKLNGVASSSYALKSYVPNASTITCGGTDKISAYNNASGVFTCSADQTGAASGTPFTGWNGTSADNVSASGGWYNDILNLTLTLPSTGVAIIECDLLVWTNATATGIQFNTTLDTGSSSQNTMIEYMTAATAYAICSSTTTYNTCSPTTSAGTQISPIKIRAVSVRNGAGSWHVNMKSELAGGTRFIANVTKGSWCRYISQ